MTRGQKDWLEAYLLAVEAARASGCRMKVRGLVLSGTWFYIVDFA